GRTSSPASPGRRARRTRRWPAASAPPCALRPARFIPDAGSRPFASTNVRPWHAGGVAADEVPAFESVSTWRQPVPLAASAERSALIAGLAERIDRLSPGRLRVAVDGYTAAGKTCFGHELAAALRELGRPTL